MTYKNNLHKICKPLSLLASSSALFLIIGMLGCTDRDKDVSTFEHSSLYDEFVKVDKLDGIEDGNAKYLTSRLCAQCHDHKVDEVLSSVHYLFRSENKNIDFPGGGSHGHVDRFSGLSGGETTVNYLYGGKVGAGGCGSCHVGRYMPGSLGEVDIATGLSTPAMEKVRDGIDCLVCHAKKYDGRKHTVTDYDLSGNLETYWQQDRTWGAVLSIGKTQTENCLRCHDHPASTDERGTPFRGWNDVHIEDANKKGYNACTSCHTVEHHKTVRGNYVVDIFASDYEVGSAANEIKCQKCHTNEPHDETVLNTHIDKISCLTCHIPWTSGVTYASWDQDGEWRRYGRADEYSEMDSKPYVTENGDEREIWEAYKFRPKYMWFNGKASYIGQPFGSKEDGKSKIYPFHPIASGLPVDTGGIRTTDILDDATLQTALIGLGMMVPGDDPSATAAVGLGILDNKTMDSSLGFMTQAQLYQTPLLYSLDLALLEETSDIGLSINSAMRQRMAGLNNLGRVLGSPTDTPLLQIFSDGYPGNNSLTTKLPFGNIMQAQLGKNYPAFSFMTLAHGIRKSNEALRCNQCHGEAENNVLVKNRFLVFDGFSETASAKYRTENNLTVLGYGPEWLSIKNIDLHGDNDDDDNEKERP